MGIKAFVLSLFLFFFILPVSTLAAISLNVSNFEVHPDYYSIDALVEGIATSSACYVQAAFTATESAHYFGQTWSTGGNWFQYLSSPSTDFINENFPKLSNGQTFKVLIKPDITDSDYHGPGEYILKLKRYTGQSTSSAGESNSLLVTLSDPLPPSETPTPSPSASSTPTPTQSSTPSPTIYPSITPTPTPSPTRTPTPTKTNTPSVIPTITLTTQFPPSLTISMSSEAAVLSTATDLSLLTPTLEGVITDSPQQTTRSTISKIWTVWGGLMIVFGLAFFYLRLKYLAPKR